MEVLVGKELHHRIEQVLALQAVDPVEEAEVLNEHVSHVLRQAIDVGLEVVCDVLRVGQQRREGKVGENVEGEPGLAADDLGACFFGGARQAGCQGLDGLEVRLQQAVHAAQDREGEDDFAIVGRSDLAAHALGSSSD